MYRHSVTRIWGGGLPFVLSLLAILGTLTMLQTASAQTRERSVEIGEAEFRLFEFEADSAQIESGTTAPTLLWLSAATNPGDYFSRAARRIAANGVNVVVTDILDAYLLGHSRGAMMGVPPEDMKELFDDVLSHYPGRLITLAAGRVAIPVLRGINLWQRQTDDLAAIAGSILVSPNLYVGVPELGRAAEYFPITSVSAIPIYLMQPRLSVRTFRIAEVASVLGQSGSQVFTAVSKGLAGNFFFEPTEVENAEAVIEELIASTTRAMRLLATQTPTESPPRGFEDEKLPERTNLKNGLVSMSPRAMGDFSGIVNLGGESVDGPVSAISSNDHKIIIVNFWASWCPPCIEEIPSMTAFYETYVAAGKSIELYAVSVGESIQELETFLATTPLPFPVMLDANGDTARGWGVFTYPTTLVVDDQSRLVAGAVGVVDWSAPETRALIDSLLNTGG